VTVSVIVPTHQRRELVREAVDSVLAQSFRDFELIVIDDGSTDGTGEALDGIDPRLVYRWQENRGVSAARNAGIELAGGEIVAFLDSDNLWRREHLAIVCELLERSPEAVLASTCPRFALKGSETASDAVLRPWRDEVMPGARFAGFVSCFAVRRAALRRAGMFDEALSCGEDSDLVARLALLGPFATISRQTLVRRTSEGSLQSVSHATGSYLQVAERQAANLRTFAEQLDQPRDVGARRRAEDAHTLNRKWMTSPSRTR